MPEVEAPTAPTAPAAQPAIKMGQSLTSQQAALTRILQSDAPIKPEKPAAPKEEPKVDKPVEEPVVPPVTPTAPEPVEAPVAPAVELPAIGKYIYDKLPTIQTRIKDGESVKVVSFKDVSELPAGFELADDSARAQFTLDISNQLDKARGAMAEYKQIELNNNIKAFDAQEAKDVTASLARLVRQGLIEKFDDNDPADHPGVKVANDIYKLFKDTNTAYREQGKTYRITYEDAADKYFLQQSRQAANDSQKAKDQLKEEKPKKTEAQKQRDEVASKQGGSGGEPGDNKPKVRAGMTMADINKLVNAGRI